MKLSLKNFTDKDLTDFINYPFTFDSYKILLEEAYTPEQVANLRYYLWVHSDKCTQEQIEKVNNEANEKLELLIQKVRNHIKNSKIKN